MTTSQTPSQTVPWYFAPMIVLIAGCVVAIINFGVRSTFGLFTLPITEANQWPRETFSLAIAIQNLVWGIATPIAGMLADLGCRWVIVGHSERRDRHRAGRHLGRARPMHDSPRSWLAGEQGQRSNDDDSVHGQPETHLVCERSQVWRQLAASDVPHLFLTQVLYATVHERRQSAFPTGLFPAEGP